MWDLPLTIGCTIHRRRLLTPQQVLQIELTGHDVAPVPIGEPLATLENYTHQALTTGTVTLPGRRVHAGVWFRLLRCLLDELTLSTAALRKQSAAPLAQVWEAAELSHRAGMRMWQPYERLPWHRQEDLLTTAALALDLVAHGRIRARGTLAPLLVTPAPDRVYPGDAPVRTRARLPEPRDLRRTAQFAALVEELEVAVRTDPETARQVLGFLIHNDPSPGNLLLERELLIRKSGMPPHFVHTRTEVERLLVFYGHEPEQISAVLDEFTRETRRFAGPAANLFIPDDLAQLRARLMQ